MYMPDTSDVSWIDSDQCDVHFKKNINRGKLAYRFTCYVWLSKTIVDLTIRSKTVKNFNICQWLILIFIELNIWLNAPNLTHVSSIPTLSPSEWQNIENKCVYVLVCFLTDFIIGYVWYIIEFTDRWAGS